MVKNLYHGVGAGPPAARALLRVCLIMWGVFPPAPALFRARANAASRLPGKKVIGARVKRGLRERSRLSNNR
jgi:hypothetical protein